MKIDAAHAILCSIPSFIEVIYPKYQYPRFNLTNGDLDFGDVEFPHEDLLKMAKPADDSFNQDEVEKYVMVKLEEVVGEDFERFAIWKNNDPVNIIANADHSDALVAKYSWFNARASDIAATIDLSAVPLENFGDIFGCVDSILTFSNYRLFRNLGKSPIGVSIRPCIEIAVVGLTTAYGNITPIKWSLVVEKFQDDANGSSKKKRPDEVRTKGLHILFDTFNEAYSYFVEHTPTAIEPIKVKSFKSGHKPDTEADDDDETDY